MVFKSFCKVFWLALQPFDRLQNAIGAVGVIVNFLVSLGAIVGTGAVGWVYFPQNNEAHTHSWLPAVIAGVSAFALFVLVAAWRLQVEKDKLNDVKFRVEARVYNQGAVLEVTNEAQTAVFRATGRVLQDVHHQSEPYRLFWDGYGGEVNLGNGDMAGILVARQEFITTTGCGLQIFKSTTQGERYFLSGLWQISDGKADPVYVEVIIKPISSSKKEHKAYYVLEQPTITQLVFRKVDSLPEKEQG